jgi:hypothetical protein
MFTHVLGAGATRANPIVPSLFGVVLSAHAGPRRTTIHTNHLFRRQQ